MRRVPRIMFLVHRWVGVILALLMALWTLSGFVMMYVSYPATSAEERLAGLQPLDLSGCCGAPVLPVGPIAGASVEMALGKPVLRIMTEQGPQVSWLADGKPAAFGPAEAARVAAGHVRRAFDSSAAVSAAPIEVDQWTLQLRRYAPLYRASVADSRGTVLYISGLTGEVVQDTHRTERFWNWFGAVPHWLYFTALRQDGALWSQVVIWTSLLGTFLTLTGLYVGIVTFRRGKRASPFRGIALWHHLGGLVFGLAMLTWVFSGFASMNPWGWLESEGPGAELQAIAGRPIEGTDVAALVAALAAHPHPGIVSAEVVVEDGTPYAILVGRDGARLRATLPNLEGAIPSESELAVLARAAKRGAPIASQGLIAEGDAYYYAHHSTRALLPAWRVVYGDAAATRLYLDPRTGEPVDFVDSGSRSFRWWHLALHRLDVPGLRERPLWDAVTLVLLAGVALVSLLGLWMGVRRLRRTF